jgi:hypothetical protein
MAKQDDSKATNLNEEDRKFLKEHGDELSDSTKRAKWINTPDERADHDGQTLATRSHAVIEAWAEKRGGVPATVPGTEHDGRPGVLRILFNKGDNGRLEEISWDDWFRSFDDRDLVFLFQQKMRDGHQSNFFRLDNPNREDA